MNILYTRIRELANDRNLSLAEIERRLNLSNGIISTWKNSKPSQDKIELIADFFRVSTDYLLGRDTSTHTDVDLDKALDNAMTFEGRALTDEERAAMKEILKAYLKTKK